MNEPIREDGFLFSEGFQGGLDGYSKFFHTKEEAECYAKKRVQADDQSFPVYVVPVTQFVTKRIQSLRGQEMS